MHNLDSVREEFGGPGFSYHDDVDPEYCSNARCRAIYGVQRAQVRCEFYSFKFLQEC